MNKSYPKGVRHALLKEKKKGKKKKKMSGRFSVNRIDVVVTYEHFSDHRVPRK